MDYYFELTETPSARKSFPIPPKLKAAIENAGRETAIQELMQIEEFTLSIVTMSDEELRELNVRSLDHDYYTDILTFEIDRTKTTLSAELYFSVDRAKDNAHRHRTTPENELVLLTIHGVLHLAGFDDHDPIERKRMVARQRALLARLRFQG